MINKRDRAEFRDRLAQLELGLEDRMEQNVGLLSGGQRQALTLLMATLVTPKLLLLDEHTAALDPATAEKVLALTKRIVAENGITCLMITHNIPSALALGNRTIMMGGGRILARLEGEERSSMTAEDLLKLFHSQGLSNDRVLFSAK
jgi:putative ABC transport system ATP-binding protein